MSLMQVAGAAAVELAKNEGIQSRAASTMGMLFPYAGIRKRALDMYISDIEKSNLPAESKVIAVLNAKDTIKKLKNRKEIADIAIENAREGTDFTPDSGINQEWLERFMESAGFVSEEEVQLMWGKILANEFERPGSTPPNMIRVLSEITPQYAKAFQAVCSMRRYLLVVDEDGKLVEFRRDIVVPYVGNEKAMKELGLSFNTCNELETLGLIKFEALTGFVAKGIAKNCTVCTYVDGVTKELEVAGRESIPAGNVALTDAGSCLFKITEPIQVANYEALESNYMNRLQVKYKEKTAFEISEDGKGGLYINKEVKKEVN